MLAETFGTLTVANPGFPAVASDMGAFRQKRIWKWKNWVPLGEGEAAAPPPNHASANDVDGHGM